MLGLLHEDSHYDALFSLPGFFGKDHFCSRCFQAYHHPGQHACPNNKANHCRACLQEGCQDHAKAYRHYRSAHVLCPLCGRSFYGTPVSKPIGARPKPANPSIPNILRAVPPVASAKSVTMCYIASKRSESIDVGFGNADAVTNRSTSINIDASYKSKRRRPKYDVIKNVDVL